jgi:hypothetical protein
MSFNFRVDSLTFAQPNDAVKVLDTDVVVLVGPNNSGKSQALRDIEQGPQDSSPGLVIKVVTSHREGTVEEVLSWLGDTAAMRTEGGGEWAVSSQGTIVRLEHVALLWPPPQNLEQLAQQLVLRADAETRLQLAASVASVDAVDGEAVSPLQRLLKDHAAEASLSEAVRHAFRVRVCVNRAGGSQLSLHLGQTTAAPRLDSAEYLAELKALPLVASQGDGMRSFIGLMLTLTATSYPVVLIDEPEAFLHPPQARELGYQLATPSTQQRFIATHSVDVLLGLLDRASSLVVIRLRRHENQTVAAVLDHDRITALWQDASLRYSNLLDGLFHSGVVICEAEGDARLYAATLDATRASKGDPATDLLFTPCGGKHKLPVAVDALYPLGVPVCAIADIDILRDSGLLKQLVEALGGKWEAIEPDCKIVANAVSQMPVQAPVIANVRTAIDMELGDDPTARLSEEQTRRVREITKTTDGWRLLRETGGWAALPGGETAAAGARLSTNLQAIGLFVVPVGMLERWDPTIGKHGLAFVDAAFSSGVHEQNAALREFVARVDTFLANSSQAIEE